MEIQANQDICYVCYETLTDNKCTNTNYEGTGENCPVYGLEQ